MSVGQIKIQRRDGGLHGVPPGWGQMVFQNESGIKGDIGQERTVFIIRVVFKTAVAGAAFFLCIPLVLFYHIVVSIEHV